MRVTMAFFLAASSLGAAACKAPTQVTLEVSSDARCQGEPSGAGVTDFLRDVAIYTASTFGATTLAPSAVTESCALGDAERRDVGSLVLVPGTGRSELEVLVIAGVRRIANGAPDATKSAEQCAALLAEGKLALGASTEPCIFTRRRLAFIESKPLVLPVSLDAACIGVVCGADQACASGACVPAEVTCSNGTCSEPAGATSSSATGTMAGAGGASSSSNAGPMSSGVGAGPSSAVASGGGDMTGGATSSTDVAASTASGMTATSSGAASSGAASSSAGLPSTATGGGECGGGVVPTYTNQDECKISCKAHCDPCSWACLEELGSWSCICTP